MYWSSIFLLGLAHLAATKPLASRRWYDFGVKHAWAEIPQGWKLHGPASSDYTFDMRIGLKQNRFDELVTALYEVSNPSNGRYGKHLSKEEVAALVAPHPDSVDLVESWLSAHGLDTSSCQRSESGDWITVRVSVGQAEKMLGTQYSVFHHDKSDDYVVRTMNYSLPSVLREHIMVVTPTTLFGTTRSLKETTRFNKKNARTFENDTDSDPFIHSSAAVPSSCATTVTPTCLRALYNTTDYVPKATDKNKIGVTGYLNLFANHADLQTFFNLFRPDAVGTTFTTVLVNGGGDDQNDPGNEANLDIQYTEGIAFPTPNIFYSTGGAPPFIPDDGNPTNTNEPYLDWLNFILSESTIPQTITTSYGDDEQTVPEDYAIAVCNMFAQLGARGSSMIFSSGDHGVGSGDCTSLSDDGMSTKKFIPHFPASCPFVTAVGGTIQINPEVGGEFSGGGFSNLFPRPSYQDAAVTPFLDTLGSTYAGFFNKNGRAYPDVATHAKDFQVVIGGRIVSAPGGTSSSAPTFAAIIALLNDFRLSQGKSSLGFLNPLIYSTGIPGFNDITAGSNPGCGTNGFTAGPGWDPVTGLGTPDFGKLQALIG